MSENFPEIAAFITRWTPSGGSEEGNYQLFLSELCDALGVPRPDPSVSEDSHNAYVFQKSVALRDRQGVQRGTGRIDFYRRGCFVLETKQGYEEKNADSLLGSIGRQKRGHGERSSGLYSTSMVGAKAQAENYARNLPISEGRPPFLIVVDVGYSFELFCEFTRSGAPYSPFPAPGNSRFKLADLLKEEIRERLVKVWMDPLSLDPSRYSAEVTRKVAGHLADLAKSYEGLKYKADDVANFLMRCLFTMFAEDVGLLPKDGFLRMLESRRDKLKSFVPMVESLWKDMDKGEFSQWMDQELLRFNGGLFDKPKALPVSPVQLELLIEAAKCDWQHVEPAIFGTLLERALDPRERHKLGAHYTPRAYVERLVVPTVIEPLREEWAQVQAVVQALLKRLAEGDDSSYLDGTLELDGTWELNGTAADAARSVVKHFHQRLCEVKVLDPACGSGNFLYVAMELLKVLEEEVLKYLADLGESQEVLHLLGQKFKIDPHNFLGIEINPRAAIIAEMVLWIGFLQWHFRNHQDAKPQEPVLDKFQNIECRDAVFTWEAAVPLLDKRGKPRTRWDGKSMRLDDATGELIPDTSVRVPILTFTSPQQAKWPTADFVVGNPPFIGNKRMRSVLGDGYVEAVRTVYPEVTQSADLVMYWWEKAANLVKQGSIRRFGLITTNSITQQFNRKVVERHLEGEPPLSLLFAVGDHPWVDSASAAAVRIAMTVGVQGKVKGTTGFVIEEKAGPEGEMDVKLQNYEGIINANLSVGVNVNNVQRLRSNRDISFQGVIPVGSGFRLSYEQLLSLKLDPSNLPIVVKPFIIGRDIAQKHIPEWIIDLYPLSEEQVREKYPALLQHLIDYVKPERDQNRMKSRRNRWWWLGSNASQMRTALQGTRRFIATIETSKHMPFVFIDSGFLPDHQTYAFASEDGFLLGVLSSKVHKLFALAAGAKQGVGNDPRYRNSTVFLPFPFPDPDDKSLREKVAKLAEELDALRKRQQGLYPDLTITAMYNVLEKERAGEALTPKEREIHRQGLISILRMLHDELDQAVAASYGWEWPLPDEVVLERLVALNHERAAEEAEGKVRWLRPEFQAPEEYARRLREEQTSLLPDEEEVPSGVGESEQQIFTWPKSLPEQLETLRQVLMTARQPLTSGQVVERITWGKGRKGDREERVKELLRALVVTGLVKRSENTYWV